MPKRQSREIQAVVAAGAIAASEEESDVADWVMGCAVWEKETGKESRAAGVETAGAAEATETAGTVVASDRVVASSGNGARHVKDSLRGRIE